MALDRFKAFLDSDDTLRIYYGNKLIFSSKKDRLLPLMDYIGTCKNERKPVVVYDKIMGNAAAMLCVEAGAVEVYSPVGSELAVKTLDKHGIRHHLLKTSPYIIREDGKGMCPMEELSIGKEPDEFYRIMKERIEQSK